MSAAAYDTLLTFLSEKGAGEWQDLKGAFDWLVPPDDDPAHRAWVAARDLAALGHIEIAWGDEITWCAAPPLLTMLPRSGGRALLTGARTRHLTKGVQTAADELGLWVDECEQNDGPRTLLLACETHHDAEGLAADLGIGYTYSVADQLAGILPPLDAYLRLFGEASLPQGFPPEKFDPDDLGWYETDDSSDHGLYRCRTFSGHVYALRDWSGRSRRVVREIGIYEVLRWEDRAILEYDGARDELRVPGRAGLPALHARAATLCSGRLPHTVSPRGEPVTLAYLNVTRRVADGIASSLGQVLAEAA